MELRTLISALDAPQVVGADQLAIGQIVSDSRRVVPGSLFVAVRGVAVDGHQYIASAIEKGAVAIVCEKLPEALADKATFIVVKDSAYALGMLLSRSYGDPSQKLKLVGVTGTNGKTTIATVLYELFRRLGYKVGLLSTVCNYIDGEAIPTDHTTPDPITLHALIARMVEAGCTYAFMEVSSHSIDQRRISGLDFDGGIFTNLTRDHLDYHKTVENYLKAKKKFFDELPAKAFALTNVDDKSGMVMLQNTKSHLEGTDLLINDKEVTVRFVGRFNAYNLLAVYGAAVSLGADPDEVLVALSAMHPVSGRFETIHSPEGFTAIVDYAHTPDALTNVLNSIHEVLEGKGRIITVVGAGGNRDKGKRPLMAKEAARLSDQVILTSDNPRFEEPDAIIQDMVAGLTKADLERTLCITDRAQAIKTATMLAKRGDVILVAGKGHEDYQEVKGVKHHFDDREQLRKLFHQA